MLLPAILLLPSLRLLPVALGRRVASVLSGGTALLCLLLGLLGMPFLLLPLRLHLFPRLLGTLLPLLPLLRLRLLPRLLGTLLLRFPGLLGTLLLFLPLLRLLSRPLGLLFLLLPLLRLGLLLFRPSLLFVPLFLSVNLDKS